MKIAFNQFVGDHTLLEARNGLRKLQFRSFRPNISDMERFWPDITKKTLKAFINEKYIAPTKEDKTTYEVSTLGMRLCATKATRRFNREKGMKSLNALIERAKQINASDDLVKVKQIVLFGSFLDETLDDYGDIDVAIDYYDTIPHKELVARSKRAAQEARVQGLLEQLFYFEKVARTKMKGRDPKISMVPFLDLEYMDCPTKIVFDINS